MKFVYIVYCFKHFDYQEESEIQFVCHSKKKALKIIEKNSCNFQDQCWNFCKLVKLRVNKYMFDYLGNVKCGYDVPLFYKAVKTATGYKWDKMSQDDIALEFINDYGLFDAIDTAKRNFINERNKNESCTD